jgi:transcriptional regulator with XRE-family HTH domain
MEFEMEGLGLDPLEKDLLNESFKGDELEADLGPRSKTSLRINYEAQVAVIRRQTGSLESVRVELGLSQRKMAQLLMVDPSSWTRWTKQGDVAPPHIWRALQWYLALREKIPGLTPHYFTGTNPQVLHQKALAELDQEREQRLQQQSNLERKLDALTFEKAKLESSVERFKKDLKFQRKLSIFFLLLSLCWASLIFIGK